MKNCQSSVLISIVIQGNTKILLIMKENYKYIVIILLKLESIK